MAAPRPLPTPAVEGDRRAVCLVERLKVVTDYLAAHPHHELRGGADLLRVIPGTQTLGPGPFDTATVNAQNAWLLFTMRDCLRSLLRGHGDRIARAADALADFPVASVAMICPCPEHQSLSRAAWNAVAPRIMRQAKAAGLLTPKGGAK